MAAFITEWFIPMDFGNEPIDDPTGDDNHNFD